MAGRCKGRRTLLASAASCRRLFAHHAPPCRRTRHGLGRQPSRQQPAMGAARRETRRLPPQLLPVKGLAAAALQG